MSTVETKLTSVQDAPEKQETHVHPQPSSSQKLSTFLSTYVFSKDHKVIGLQFLFSTLLWFLIGGLLALAVRWQVAWPWSDVPVVGKLFAQQGGQMAPEFYTMLFTMHATVMISCPRTRIRMMLSVSIGTIIGKTQSSPQRKRQKGN